MLLLYRLTLKQIFKNFKAWRIICRGRLISSSGFLSLFSSGFEDETWDQSITEELAEMSSQIKQLIWPNSSISRAARSSVSSTLLCTWFEPLQWTGRKEEKDIQKKMWENCERARRVCSQFDNAAIKALPWWPPCQTMRNFRASKSDNLYAVISYKKFLDRRLWRHSNVKMFR